MREPVGRAVLSVGKTIGMLGWAERLMLNSSRVPSLVRRDCNRWAQSSGRPSVASPSLRLTTIGGKVSGYRFVTWRRFVLPDPAPRTSGVPHAPPARPRSGALTVPPPVPCRRSMRRGSGQLGGRLEAEVLRVARRQ